MSNLDSKVKQAVNRIIDRENAGVPAGAPRFREPNNETWLSQHRKWQPKGYYRLFCAHDKPLWEPCASGTCRRDSKEAHTNLVKLCNGTL